MYSKIKITHVWVLLSFLMPFKIYSQSDSLLLIKYSSGYDTLQKLLKINAPLKKAVLLTENIYANESLPQAIFDSEIGYLKAIIKKLNEKSFSNGYRAIDSSNYLLNYTIVRLFSDTINITRNLDKSSERETHIPFSYDFTDPFGKTDWGNMFVTKLLATHKGNCHSLAYLYKILADELGAKCWLALAPGHIYIRNYSDKIGWYNTELTNGTFPTDAWVMTTGYVSPQAVRSGLYMDTLSNQQSIALCVLDLAKEYEFETHNYYDGFIVKCCDLVLQYHPVNPMALLLKAETLKKVFLKEQAEKYPRPTTTYNEMQNAYITLAKLGYREMPEKMYQKWLKNYTVEKDKYIDKKLIDANTKK